MRAHRRRAIRPAMYQRKAKTETRSLAVERALRLDKDIEDRRDEFGRHANAAVDHGERRVIEMPFDRDPDMTARRRVFDCITQQVGADLLDPHCIPIYR